MASRRPDVVACNRAITACAKGQSWPKVAGILEEMSCRSIEADVITFTSAMNAFSKSHLWNIALQLFRESLAGSVEGNIILYGNAISACEKGHQWPAALKLLQQLQVNQLESNVIVYSAAISACEKAGEWAAALVLLEGCRDQQVEANRIAYSATISACEKGSKWPEALHLLQTLAPRDADVVMYNAAISSMDDWQLALALLVTLKESNLRPTVVSYNACLDAVRGAAWPMGFHLLEEMFSNDLEATLITYNTLISSLGSSFDAWPLALILLEDLPKLNFRPNDLTYTGAMGACERGECWDGALALLAQIPAPDVVALGAALSCQQWPMALELLSQMQQRGLQPNLIICSAAIAACEKGEEWQAALQLLREALLMKGLVDSVVPFNSAMSACEKQSEWTWSLEILRLLDMQGLKADEIAVGAAIRACDRVWQWRSVLRLLAQMTESALPKTNAWTLAACVGSCQKGERSADALCLLRAVSELGESSLEEHFQLSEMSPLAKNVLRGIAGVGGGSSCKAVALCDQPLSHLKGKRHSHSAL